MRACAFDELDKSSNDVSSTLWELSSKSLSEGLELIWDHLLNVQLSLRQSRFRVIKYVFLSQHNILLVTFTYDLIALKIRHS